VKQHLAAIRMLFDFLVTGQIVPLNPAAAVRGPKHIVKKGKTSVLSTEEMRTLLDSLNTGTLIDLRDRALIALMGVLSSAGQYFLLLGYQRGPASLLAPFSYMQIITSTFWGAVLFGTWPGASTLIGAAIVVASGLYVLHRERMRRGEPR